jgi:hypothetical protein
MIIPVTIERFISLLCALSVQASALQYKSTSAQNAYLRRSGARAHKICRTVAHRAHSQGLDIYEVIAVSQHETRHRADLIGTSGERGPLQAIPRYWKRKGDRDAIDSGLRAWRYFRERSTTTQEAAGRYNGAGEKSAYAREVAEHADMLRRKSAWMIPR